MTSAPPLLRLAQGCKVRPRKAPAIRPKEITLHFAVAKLLCEHCKPDWLWTHIAHGEVRDKRTAAKLKAMGTRPGWPDFILVPPTGRLHRLDLKRLGENLSADQDSFRLWCVAHGVLYSVCRTLDEVLAVFDSWKCTRLTIPARLEIAP